eukprot:Phypoly_transcript_24079.p1 GENE.Phypoly_transcript_24079~~Phypoly_transcript_24079.p1  ORF type:complete len:111 (+),score=21.75 Phypoly_transcript_24079:206-538(+)
MRANVPVGQREEVEVPPPPHYPPVTLQGPSTVHREDRLAELTEFFNPPSPTSTIPHLLPPQQVHLFQHQTLHHLFPQNLYQARDQEDQTLKRKLDHSAEPPKGTSQATSH